MAIVCSPILYRMSGKLGNVVFYQVGRQTRMRQRPAHVKVSNCASQVVQRNRMRGIVAFYQTNRDTLLRRVWSSAPRCSVSSGYNLFVHTNISVFDGLSKIGDYGLLKVSCGSLSLPYSLGVARGIGRRVCINWEVPNFNSRSSYRDCLMVMWLRDNGSFTLQAVPDMGFCRDNGHAEVEIPASEGERVHLYCFFRSADWFRFSESKHFLVDFGKV